MVRRFKLSVGASIYILIGLGFLGLIGIASIDLRELSTSLKEQKQVELRHLVDLAVGIAKEEHAAAERGAVPAAEAQKIALARITALRYDGNEYFFVSDMQHRILAHGVSAQLVGKDLSDTKDPTGKRLVVDLVDAVRKNGSGFVDYVWAKPGADKPQPKLSYVAGFAPWGWAITTGVYVDDLDAQTWAAAQRSLLAAVLVMLLTLVVSIVMARRITRPLKAMTGTMGELAAGNLQVAIPGVGRRDEIGEMAEAVAVFKTNAV
ncbi:MAG: cache domain-containing protein, partial [Rhodoplanes sp.]|uniref:cache domain-containing protein n=1 Tax=Rhodoplanes sp. TaxID=1968906 RepID=UPI00184F18C6